MRLEARSAIYLAYPMDRNTTITAGRRPRSQIGVLFAFAALALGACGGNDSPADPNAGPSHVRAAGTVSASTGRVSGASVIVSIGELGAGRTCTAQFVETTTTTSDGEFGITVLTGLLTGTACVVVQVRPPAGSDLRTREVRAPEVPFRPTSSPPAESRVDITLESASPF